MRRKRSSVANHKNKFMRRLIVTLFCSVVLLSGCVTHPDREAVTERIESEFARGNFSEVTHLADSLRGVFRDDTLLMTLLDSLQDQSMRIRHDFSLSETDVQEQLRTIFKEFRPEEQQQWENLNWLEYRNIDGEKRYFRRAASNLKRILDHQTLLKDHEKILTPDDFDLFKMDHAAAVICSAGDAHSPLIPVPMKLKYTLSVNADAIPTGEIIRCWMPWPREVHPRQKEVRLIRTSPEKHFIAPDTLMQRSLYMEQPAVAGQPTLFEMEFSFTPSAHYSDPQVLVVSTCDKNSGVYAAYTGEQKPHILFSEKIKELADRVVGREQEPLKIVQAIFNWIDTNIPWAGALEYSTIPNIPEYVIDNRRGDCGMKTLLFMTLARYRGVPVKWQSGWMLHPGKVNLHDWCEVWFDQVGWVPLDISFGRLPSDNPVIRDFYMTGIDSWRLIVNDNIGAPFVPGKKFPRSEPNDFQRGEVEWSGGNLYFDKWDYHMEVDYLPPPGK